MMESLEQDPFDNGGLYSPTERSGGIDPSDWR
jgi:hypothetical protein